MGVPHPNPYPLQIEAEKKRVALLDQQIRAYDAKALEKRKAMGGMYGLSFCKCTVLRAILKIPVAPVAQVSMRPRTTRKQSPNKSSFLRISWKRHSSN